MKRRKDHQFVTESSAGSSGIEPPGWHQAVSGIDTAAASKGDPVAIGAVPAPRPLADNVLPEREELLERGLFDGGEAWEPEMRFDCQEIVPGILLSGFSSVKEARVLREMGVTNVVLVRCPMEAQRIYPRHPEFDHMILETPMYFKDLLLPSLPRFIEHVKSIIGGEQGRNKKVLIMGLTGVSKSAALLIAYVMAEHLLTFRQAYDYVVLRRAAIHLTNELRQQLNEWEAVVFKYNDVRAGWRARPMNVKQLNDNSARARQEESSSSSLSSSSSTASEDRTCINDACHRNPLVGFGGPSPMSSSSPSSTCVSLSSPSTIMMSAFDSLVSPSHDATIICTSSQSQDRPTQFACSSASPSQPQWLAATNGRCAGSASDSASAAAANWWCDGGGEEASGEDAIMCPIVNDEDDRSCHNGDDRVMDVDCGGGGVRQRRRSRPFVDNFLCG